MTRLTHQLGIPALLLGLAVACANGPEDLTTPVLGMAQVAGEYQLTHIRVFSGEPERALPTWSFPGRVLVLEGGLTLRPDGRYVATTSSRVTMFGDTTYGASADSASWQLLPGNVIRFLNGGYPETQARVSRDAVVVFPGGVDAGAGYYRYQRR